MQTVVYNEKQLEVVIGDMFNRFNEYKSLAISYDKPFKDKTLKQLGFIFGGLVSSIIEFQKECGVIKSNLSPQEMKDIIEEIKDNFYIAVSKIEPSLICKRKFFDGKYYDTPKRLSQMSCEEASVFIDKCIYLIDNAKCFQGLILHPSLRYTWVRHVSKDDLLEISRAKMPRLCSEYLEHTRKQACLCCGKNNVSQVHHLKLAGESGTGFKADDWLTIPLCSQCHLGELHQKGQKEFYKNLEWITKYISLVDFCRLRFLKWQMKK